MDFLKGGLWPMGDYPNLLGITPIDRRPKLEEYSMNWGIPFGEKTVYTKTPMRKEDISIPEECSIRYLADRIFAKAKYRPPTFEEFCKKTELYEDFDINQLESIYLVEYKDKVVGTLRCKIIVPLDGLGMQKLPSKDIREAIQEYKLQMYHRLTQEYDKKNKEATIKEEKKMINIPGMNEREVRALVDGLNEICYDVSVKWEDAGFGVAKGILKLELPVEKARYLKVTGQSIAKQSSKSSWLEGIPAVKKVETYNQRVVKVTFIDDTFTKSICSENDHFDIDVGITICLLKRILGTNGDDATRNYNKLMNQVHAVMEKNEKEKVAAQAQKSADKAKKRKIELKRAAKKLKAKEEQIDIQKQAIIRAHQEMEGMEQ